MVKEAFLLSLSGSCQDRLLIRGSLDFDQSFPSMTDLLVEFEQFQKGPSFSGIKRSVFSAMTKETNTIPNVLVVFYEIFKRVIAQR